MTSAASYSACWRRLRQGFQRADAVDDMPMRPADVEDHPEHFEAWQQSQVHQQLHQLPTEKDSFLDAMTAVWEGCTNPAQRAVFFAPLWDSGVPTPTSRAVANAAAAPGWQRGMFSPQPHVGVVSLVGKVVGLVPGVLSGIAAAEALQARCAAESRARHLGIVLSLGNQWSPNAAESIAEAAVPGLAPRLESLHRLMEDLRELSAVLSAHAVWEQQDGLWNEDGSGSGHINVGRSGSSNSSKAPGPARAGSWGGEGDNPEVNSFLEAAALAARGVGLGSGNKSSNRSSSTANRPVPASGSASGSGSISVPGLQSTPGAHLQQWQQQAAEARGVPSLLWISAAALARGVSACSPSDRLKVLAMLVPPPSRHNGGWKGQAALITCLAASTAAAANMFLMGMMAIHHLGNVFAGEGATLLNQLKLGCATLLALAPDEASAIAGSYFLELCVAIVALAPPRAPGAAMGPPTSTLCPKIVVDHALTTIITLLEREGTPTGRPAVSLAALQTLFRLLRRPRLPQVSRTIGLQPVRWIRALVASIRVQRAGGRVSLLVVIKALEVLWAVLARCNMGSLDGVMAEVNGPAPLRRKQRDGDG